MNKLTRLLVLALSLALLVGAMIGFGITSSADEEPTVSVAGKNMSYTGAVQVMYYIKTTGTVDMNNVRLLVSNDEFSVTTEDNVANLDANISVKVCRGTLTPATGSLVGASYGIFYSDAIAPVELRQAINAVPVIVDAEGNITYVGTASNGYSPYQYAMNRFSAGSTDIQRTLYKALLDYGASVQAVLLRTDEEVAKVGGWADAYYNVKVDTYVDGVLTAEGTAAPCRAAATINADSSLDSSKLFIGFTNGAGYNYIYDEGKNVAITSMTCSSLKDPGTYTVVKNYSTKHGATETFDEFDQNDLELSGATYYTDAVPADSHGYVLNKNGSLTVGSNNMYYKGNDAKTDNGTTLIKPTGNFSKGDYIVIDTDFTFNTNYLLASDTDWIVKLYPCGGSASSDFNQIFNIPLYVGNGETFSMYGKSFDLGQNYRLRMIIVPSLTDKKVDFYVYMDDVLVNRSIGATYLGENLNGTKGTANKTNLKFGGLVVNHRYGSSLKAHTGGDALWSSIVFDNTFIGAIPGEYVEEYNYNDFSDAQSLQGIGTNNKYTAANLVSNGALNLNMVNGGNVYFKPVRPISDGDADDRYVFEMDFTYNGGTKKDGGASDLGTGFIGFSWSNGGDDSYMYWYSWIRLTGEPDANGVYPAVKFYERTYNKGVTYKIRYEYNPGNATIDIFENGEYVYTVNQKVNNSIDQMSASSSASTKAIRSNTVMYKGSRFESFSISFRGSGSTGADPDTTSFTFDNTYCGYTTCDNTSDVVFDANGGTGAGQIVTVKPGETLTLPAINPTKTLTGSNISSEFLGWKNGVKYAYVEPNVVTQDVMLSSGAWYSLATTTVTAKWKDPVKVTLVNEGNSSDEFFFADGSYDLGIPKHSTLAPEKFLGWHYGTTKVETTGNTWTLGTNVTLDAWWDASYKVTFNAGDGTFVGEAPTLDLGKGDTYTLPLASTMSGPDGKVFLGWYIGMKRVADTGAWMYDEDITLTAKWGLLFEDHGDVAATKSGKNVYTTNYSAEYEKETKYYVSMSFTYLGAGLKSDGSAPDKNAAFMSLLGIYNGGNKGTEHANYNKPYLEARLAFDYAVLGGELVEYNGKNFYSKVTFGDCAFEIGQTYNIVIEYTVGNGKDGCKLYVIADDGTVIKEGTLNYGAGGAIDAYRFGGFAIQPRSEANYGKDGFNYKVDDLYFYVI